MIVIVLIVLVRVWHDISKIYTIMILLTQLKIILRGWERNLLSTFISVVSLVLGLACSSVLLLFVLNERDVAGALGTGEPVYIMREKSAFYGGGESVIKTSSSRNRALEIKNGFPEVADLMLIRSLDYHWGKEYGNRPMPSRLFYASPNLPDFLNIPVAEGNLVRTLSRPDEVALTRSAALRIFGEENPMNRQFRMKSSVYYTQKGPTPQRETVFTVTTLLEDPDRLPLTYDGFTGLSMERMERERKQIPGEMGYTYSFFKLVPDVSNTDFERKVVSDTSFLKDRLHLDGEDRWIGFTPIDDIYFETEKDVLFKQRDRSLLVIGLGIALAVLVIGIFNFVNITMTRSASRLKNISGQRIMGASRACVSMQVICDTALLTLVSFGVSLLLIYGALPYFSEFMDSSLVFRDFWTVRNLSVMFLLLVVVVAVSSSFILLKMQTGRPLQMFRNPVGNKMRMARAMVVLQFVVSVVLIVFSLTVERQMRFVSRALPGTDKMLMVKSEKEFPLSFVDQVKSLAAVRDYTQSPFLPTMFYASEDFNCTELVADDHYFDFYGVELVEGRFPQSGESDCIVVNETFVKRKGWDHGVGQRYDGDLRIVGVIRDYMTDQASRKIQPLLISQREAYRNLIVLKTDGDIDRLIDDVREQWVPYEKENPAGLTFERVDRYYRSTVNLKEHRLEQTVLFFMTVSIFLAALGLFGISWYTVQERTQEIAVRKIYGATSLQVMVRLCLRFILWVAVALTVALPCAYGLGTDWLSNFAYRVEVSWSDIWITIGAVLAIAVVTVSVQSWHAANANPSRSIKVE